MSVVRSDIPLRTSASREQETIDRERRHYDREWSAAGDLRLPDWLAWDPWAVHREKLLGDVTGLRLLDLGCGTGMWSVRFAQRGANVNAVDVSVEGIKLTLARARLHGVSDRVRAQSASAYELPYLDRSFDLVHGENILHHLDAERAGREISRILKPNGIAVFVENSANNKLLMLARKLCGHFGISKWSTDDEYPLRQAQIRRLENLISPCEIHYPYFWCFRLLDEKLFRGRKIVAPIDKVIYRTLPFLRRFSYMQILKFSCPGNSPNRESTAHPLPDQRSFAA